MVWPLRYRMFLVRAVCEGYLDHFSDGCMTTFEFRFVDPGSMVFSQTFLVLS